MNKLMPAVIAAALGMAPHAGLAADKPLSSLDSFRVGNAGVLCTAQRRSEDARYGTIFDRGYDIVCRDAASPVGQLYSLRGAAQDQGAGPDCGTDHTERLSKDLVVQRYTCDDKASGLVHVHYRLARGGTVFIAQGLLAYDSPLRTGLESMLADRPVAGEIMVATTGAGDPAALAALQAARLDPEQARAAGYIHAAEGSFAEAAEYFETLLDRARINEKGANKPAEYLANMALDQSLLGNQAQADLLFAQADRAATEGGRPFRALLRNLRVMHRINAHDPDGALALLNAPLPRDDDEQNLPHQRVMNGYIDKPLSQSLAIDNYRNTRFWGSATPLTGNEKVDLLEAQALYLRVVAKRQNGDTAGSKALLKSAQELYASVRGGQVRSMAWLVPNISIELAQIAQDEGDEQAAETYLQQALDGYARHFPDTASFLSVRARLAGLLIRHGKIDQALITYRELVRMASAIPGGTEALRGELVPYLDTLIARGGDQAAAADFFVASQAMIRPGVAQTQVVFARELSAGSDEASGLFRQSVTLSRELISLDVEISRLSGIEQRTPQEDAALTTAMERRALVATTQTGLQAQLSSFPKYRVTRNATLELADLQKELRQNEAYYKLVLIDEAAFGLFVRANDARAFKIPATRAQLESLTDTVRDSIVVEENNQLITQPFDVAIAYTLYQTLFGAVAADVLQVGHIIFEPDGPLLKLPANLLVTDKAGVDAYTQRQQADNPDPFDYRGVAWLGRDHVVSTAVSAESFVAVRNIAPSTASHRFLGLGQNTPNANLAYAPKTEEGRDPCDWPLTTWDRPISSAELTLASGLLGGNGNQVITGDGFTDTMLLENGNLADYRIIQFATHGLVTAPHPGCPARPALVTSFGPRDSDGLLSFKEIFDLRLNSDTVILSACDTAGAATAAATREAGIPTGGNFALDGLVRAFIGAGARTVVASHWPVPDDFDATTRLMTGLFHGGTSESMGEAMRQSQIRLMDDPLTSHPYYWAAFAIVGDATKPMTTP